MDRIVKSIVCSDVAFFKNNIKYIPITESSVQIIATMISSELLFHNMNCVIAGKLFKYWLRWQHPISTNNIRYWEFIRSLLVKINKLVK